MSEWWTYTLSDFLLFSPRVYYRLLELHNRELWPAHILTSGLGMVIAWLLWRPPRFGHRAAFALLGLLWIWVAWAFIWERYAAINWAAAYVAPLFALQGALLIWLGAVLQGLVPVRQDGVIAIGGRVLYVAALLAYPMLAPLLGRDWAAAESLGMMPDPTAVATVAVLSLAVGRSRWPLLVIPLLWCAATAATLGAMGAPDFWVAPAGGAAGLGLMLAARR
jgi:hypothetical protein